MGWISVILAIITSIPDIIKLFKTIIDMINSKAKTEDQKIYAKELLYEVRRARRSRDWSRLEALLAKIRNK